MALFTRRVIQRCLDENAEFISILHLRDWVQRLNRISNNYVATEWEIVLLRTFARFGKVTHEPALGRRSIDILFESADGNLNFAAEIAAISDEPLHDKNPIERFRAEFSERIERAKISTGRFIFRVEESKPIPHRGTGRKRRLLLPPVNEFQNLVFNAAFEGYVNAVRQQPEQQRNHYVHHVAPPVAISIEYQPGNGSGVGSASYGSYTATTVKDDNPLFNALKSKAAQLKKSGYEGIRGIVICDRGSRMFTEMSNWATFSMDEVVKDFLRQNSSVAFVVTIGIRALHLGRGPFHDDFDPRLFIRSEDAAEDWASVLAGLLVQVTRSLPRMHQTPENAVNSLKWNRSLTQHKLYLGGWEMKGNEIRISTRELLDLLTGKLDQKRFAQHHALGNGDMFSTFQARGKMLKRAEVVRRPDEDDDWIILEFSEDDPAVSEFRLPKADKSAEAEPGD